MALTIRTTEEDDQAIKKLMQILSVNSASKALIKAAYRLPQQREKIRELEEELEVSDKFNNDVAEAYRDMKIAEDRLNNLLR